MLISAAKDVVAGVTTGTWLMDKGRVFGRTCSLPALRVVFLFIDGGFALSIRSGPVEGIERGSLHSTDKDVHIDLAFDAVYTPIRDM
ncbi:jg10596 [Pararge aegeria aegeria]|uniref:Jg10596 protein n=1 Tax=Pararge aegeria aegeria TaxID=348720 RepID=A0A8S4S0S6_9NEOP|nr:jg10596 [Pararge aegeria aegeria]